MYNKLSTLNYLLTLVFIGSAIFVEVSSHPHKVSSVEKLCAQEHYINVTLSEYLFNGTKDIKVKFGKEKFPCAIGCFLQGFGMITHEGSFNATRFVRLLPHLATDFKMDAEVENSLKSCNNIKVNCPCEVAQLILKCSPLSLKQYFMKKKWL